MGDVNNQNQDCTPPRKTTLCPVCNSTTVPMTGLYLFPLSFRDLEEASSLRRRCVASAAAVTAAASQASKQNGGKNDGGVVATGTTNALMMEDDIHQITAAAAPYLAVSHGLSGGSHSRGGGNCNDPSSASNSTNSTNNQAPAAPCPRRTSHHEIDRHRRTGRWTPEEMAYIDHLISAFDNGMLPLPNGIKLNEFLSDLLLCKSSRLTKKMKNAKLSTRLFEINLPESGCDANGAMIEEQKSPFCCGTLSRLQKLFLKSVSSEPTKLELQFNMQRMWRTHFSNLCLQIGYESLHAQDWLASLDELEQRISTVEEMVRRAQRKRMVMALQRKDSGGMGQQQPQPGQATPMLSPNGANRTTTPGYNKPVTASATANNSYKGPTSSTVSSANDFTVELNFENKKPPTKNALSASPRLMPASPKVIPRNFSSSSLTSAAGVQRSRFYSDDLSFSVIESLMEENNGINSDNDTDQEAASVLPPPAPASCSSVAAEGYYTDGTAGASTTTSVTASNQLLEGMNNINLSSPSSLGDRGPFIQMVLRYMELNNVPFEHVDVWVPSFMPRDDENTSDDNKSDGEKDSSSQDDDDNLRLCNAGHGTRADILSPQTVYNLNEFGTYSAQFSFKTGVGLPGRTYASGIPTWEESIQHSDPKHFTRCGGAKIYGVKTVLGIPVPSPSIGRIVVALYSTKDVYKDVDLVKRCFIEFSKYVPEPRWKLVIDVGASAPSQPTREQNAPTTVNVQQRKPPAQQQAGGNVVSANSLSSLSYGGGNDDCSSSTNGSHKRNYNQMRQQATSNAESVASSSKLQANNHGWNSGNTMTNSKRIKEEEGRSTANKIPATVTDDEELERQIAFLLGEQMPMDSSNYYSDSMDTSNHSNATASSHGNNNLLAGFVSLRLLLLRSSARRTAKESEMLDILKASYRGYTNGNRRGGSELARLLVRDWMFLSGSNASSAPPYRSSPPPDRYTSPLNPPITSPGPTPPPLPTSPPLNPPASAPAPASSTARHVHYGNSSSAPGYQRSPPSSSVQKSVVFGGNSNSMGNLPSPVMSNSTQASNNNTGANTSKQQQQQHHQTQQHQTTDPSGLLRRNHISFTSTSSASLSEENRNPSPSAGAMNGSSSSPNISTAPAPSPSPRSVSGGGGEMQQTTSHDSRVSGVSATQKPVIISES